MRQHRRVHAERERVDRHEPNTLDAAQPGEDLEVLEVGDDDARVHALRFGMAEGSCLHCVIRIPAGPIVVRSGRQEVAVGRRLARRIRVRRMPSAGVIGERHDVGGGAA